MEASARPGCLLFAIPRALLGGRATAALPDGIALPELDTTAVHPADLPALIRARNAARACHELVVRADLGAVPTRDAARELAGWVTRLYAMGPRLKEARAFVVRHAPDELARAQADLELELIGADAARIPELRRSIAALKQRGAHSATVRREIDQLSARLVTTAHELEALHARLGASLGSEALVHEVRAWHQAADLALDAFVKTVGDLG